MKNIYMTILSFLLLAGGQACAKHEILEPQEEGGIKFTLAADDVKTFITQSGNMFYTSWQKGDRIAVFFNDISATSQAVEFANTLQDGGAASFEGSADAPESGTIRAIYPVAALKAPREDGALDVVIPSLQYPGEGTPDVNADILAAKPLEYQAVEGKVTASFPYFTRLVSILKVDLGGCAVGEKITSLRLVLPEGVKIAGEAVLNTDDLTLTVGEGSSTITAYYGENGPAIGSGSVYFAVNPLKLHSGANLRVFAQTENTYIDKSFNLTAGMEFRAGGIANLNVLLRDTDCAPRKAAMSSVECVDLFTTPTTAKRWIDFQTGKLYSQNEVAKSTALQSAVDAGLDNSGGLFFFRNSKGSTRFFTLDMTPAEYSAIKSRVQLNKALEGVVWNDECAPMTSDKIISVPAYIAVKTWTKEEDNNYGIIEIVALGENTVRLNYKFGDTGSGPEYSGARKVTIENNKMYVDGKPFYINGAAATMKYTLMADYGANVCRIYSAGISTLNLLDQLYEKGLMCFVGLSCKSYKDFNGGKSIDNSGGVVYDNWYTPEYRAERIAATLEVVKALKDHPAVLCWSLGNEVESGSDSRFQKGMYEYYRDLNAAIKEIDTNHPVSVAFTESPSKYKMDNINGYLRDLDFISFNTYYSYLYRHRTDGDVPYKDWLTDSKGNKWGKPFVISEYGPTGTWDRGDLLTDPYISKVGRINDWGALIQLSSDEAAQNYIDCYNIIKDYEDCLGGIAFWWAFQSHGQVLGWYPFFTKDFYLLPAADAMESCWKGIPYVPKAPSVMSWKSSMALNGKNLASAKFAPSGESEKNPHLTPGQKCTAEVFANIKSGHPASTLEYKWFIYKDCVYTHNAGDTNWTSVSYTDGEWIYAPYGQNMSMNEDARAELFTDRTLKKVEFFAPMEEGGYRLYCIVHDPSNNRAGTVCINFYVDKNN